MSGMAGDGDKDRRRLLILARGAGQDESSMYHTSITGSAKREKFQVGERRAG